MKSFFFSLAMPWTARPTAETGTSTIRSTCSTSYQRRAMPPPMSGLSWWSPTTTVIGLPNTLPPKSSTAICAAVTEPWPVGVEAGPFMSVSTPILTTSSEIWASAACDDKTAAANAASADIFLAEITGVLPLSLGTSAVLLDRELTLSRRPLLQLFCGPRQLGSGGEADLAGGRRIVTGEFRGPLLQPFLADEAD